MIHPYNPTILLYVMILTYSRHIEFVNLGIVISVGDGIVNVFGLQSVQSSELVICNGSEGTVQGMALNLEKKMVGVVLFGNDRLVGLIDLNVLPLFLINVLAARCCTDRTSALDNKRIVYVDCTI